FHVRETHVLVAAGRSFNGGDRQIPLGRLTGITNIAVAEGGRPYQVVNRSTAGCRDLGIACLSINDRNEQVIYYNFFQQAQRGQERTVTIDYDVSGALRSYPGGDQLFWVALVADRPAEILASQITVTMPAGLAIDQFTSYPDNWNVTRADNVLTFTSPGVIPVGQEVEVRVQYPHNPQMAAPGWQAGFDRDVALMPILTLAGLVVGLLIAIGGTVWTLAKLASFRRDIQPPVVPEYLSEPPSDLPPGVAGTLIDGSADTKDVMATLLDLSRRGYITIEQVDEPGIFGKKADFTFHRGDAAGKLYTHENTMMGGLFKWSKVEVDLDDLKNKFYTTVNKMKSQLNAEMVNLGFYRRGPSDIFMRWLMGGIALIVLGGMGGAAILSGKDIPNLLGPLLFVFGGLGFLGAVWAVFARAMVTRTAAGQLEYVKWRAFKNYLDDIERYTQLGEARDQFEKYIGYAVAFGLEREWLRKFAPVLTSMPTWYHYAPSYGRWGSRGASWEGGGGRLGDLTGGSGGGLNQMSGNLTQGLAAMSGGLTSLLNTASAVMTSQPSSKSGGGFSGGGGGGGGSGGGSAGFH
ncbi:MAG: DUF2207 domain-containing protein, partial [Anaerolineae bacterium]|nr:DUF2207 domain-containing protein [Anaerolineae bacterium]